MIICTQTYERASGKIKFQKYEKLIERGMIDLTIIS